MDWITFFVGLVVGAMLIYFVFVLAIKSKTGQAMRMLQELGIKLQNTTEPPKDEEKKEPETDERET